MLCNRHNISPNNSTKSRAQTTCAPLSGRARIDSDLRAAAAEDMANNMQNPDKRNLLMSRQCR
jgi:hypothetical protein